VSEALRDRLSKELGSLEEQIAKILAERDIVAERFQMLQKSMISTAEEEKNTETIYAELSKKVSSHF
jgi:DNA-binding ferritin-like protein